MFDRFIAFDKFVRGAMVVLGICWGVWVVLISSSTARLANSMVLPFLISLLFGVMASIAVLLFYQEVFPDGVALPKRPGIISPNCYGITVWRHFVAYCKALAGSCTVGIAFVFASTVLFR